MLLPAGGRHVILFLLDLLLSECKTADMSSDTQVEAVCFSTRGQVVIPRRLRRKFDIQQGTRAIVYEEGDHIVIKPVTDLYLKSLRGSLKGGGLLKALTEERQRERER